MQDTEKQKLRASDVYSAISKKIADGEYGTAVEQLNKLVAIGNDTPPIHRLLSLAHACAGDDRQSLAELKAARKLATPTAKDEIDFGRALAGKNLHRAALECFLQALQIDPDNIIALSLVGMAYERQGKTEIARKYGRKALKFLDAEAQSQDLEPVARERPHPFDPSTRHRNIISYSLFGKNAYYHDAALTAARMAQAIYPEWTCRFYCGPEIPEALLNHLNRMGAQTLVAPASPENWKGLFWRFWAFDDPNVDVVLVRDVDSPFTLRERLAVDEWIASDWPFHVIRDHIWHMEPMMAGLWGGFTRLLPPMKPLTDGYVPDDEGRYQDQRFLRLNVWPRIRNATLAHDRFYKLLNSRPPPDHPSGEYNHIGFAWPKKRRRNAYADFIGLPE